ncbi:MAG: phosphoenolpyruvate-utilizing N-terminal domain-containing protein, partial [Pseudomonadota bacterium]
MKNERHGARTSAPDNEQRLDGLGVSPGIAIGPAHIVEAGAVPVPEYCILAAEAEAEQTRLQTAMAMSVKQIDKLKAKAAKLPEAAAEELTLLLDAHRSILSGSRLIRGAERRIAVDRTNAALAVQQEINDITRQFAAMNDAYLAGRAQDVREVGTRLIRNLTEEKFRAFSDVTPGSIILAEEITPADTALMDPERIAGFGTVLGGAQGHTAIMARSLGLPAVLGVPGLLPLLEPGQTVIVDGLNGQIIIDPDKATLTEFRARKKSLDADRKRLGALVDLTPSTRDGELVGLHVNLELPREVETARRLGADSVGLLRTEFMFMNRSDLPSEDEQYESLAHVVSGMDGKPVTIR